MAALSEAPPPALDHPGWPRRASGAPLVTLSIAAFMLVLEVAAANVALPRIQMDLDASLADPKIVIDSHELTIAAIALNMFRGMHYSQRPSASSSTSRTTSPIAGSGPGRGSFPLTIAALFTGVASVVCQWAG